MYRCVSHGFGVDREEYGRPVHDRMVELQISRREAGILAEIMGPQQSGTMVWRQCPSRCRFSGAPAIKSMLKVYRGGWIGRKDSGSHCDSARRECRFQGWFQSGTFELISLSAERPRLSSCGSMSATADNDDSSRNEMLPPVARVATLDPKMLTDSPEWRK